jgi:hypothetical protein
MDTPSVRREFITALRARARAVGSLLVDASFMVAWVLLQWLFLRATSGLTLGGAERWALPAAQAVLALSTLAAILLYIYWDLSTLFRRGNAGTGDPWHERPAADQPPGQREALPPDQGTLQ